MKALITHRQTERFTLLYALYRKSDGMPRQASNLRAMAFNEGISIRSFKSCFDYLCQEELIKMHSNYEAPLESYFASLTELGITVIEEVFKDENHATEYFPAYREMMM
ncbi:MAG: hypothetical protein ACPGJS_18315 [Flammeovirgaceae bacterium]